MFMHVSAISTLDWYCTCILTLVRGEFAATLAVRSKFFNSNQSGPKKKFQYATNCYAWQSVIYLGVLFFFFKWSLMFVGMKLCKKKKDLSERNSSIERVHFKKCVVPVAIQDSVWIEEKKWQIWRSVVSDGAKTFFKLFSLRGGGHYLPRGFRLSSFPLSFQIVVLVMGFTFCTSWLWWILKCPLWERTTLFIEIHLTSLIDITIFGFSECLIFLFPPLMTLLN